MLDFTAVYLSNSRTLRDEKEYRNGRAGGESVFQQQVKARGERRNIDRRGRSAGPNLQGADSGRQVCGHNSPMPEKLREVLLAPALLHRYT